MVDKFMGRELVEGSLIYGKGTRRWELNLWEGSLKMGTKYVRRALRDGSWKMGAVKYVGTELEYGSLIYGRGARRWEIIFSS